MKFILLMVILLSMYCSMATAATNDGFGIGIIAGEPTGISVKKWLSRDRALDGAVAWSFTDNSSLQIHADYLVHNFDLLKTGSVGGKLPLYAGIGARVKLQSHDDRKGRNYDDTLVGVRVPLGISYLFAKAPVDLFLEIVPVLDLIPGSSLSLNGALGARYYFH